MDYKWRVLLTTVLILLVFVNCVKESLARVAATPSHPDPETNIPCCPGCHTYRTPHCCFEGVVSDYFQRSQFENMFSNKNSLEAHAKGFWEYTLLSVPLHTTSPMVLVLPTSIKASLEPRKSQLFLLMLAL